ncbi:MAG: response regulator transcription factor [Thioalkalispiraceae bacterium]|jgi:DNA-binding NarL/FixJ family response regulator
MIISASDNKQLLSRWNSALSDEHDKQQVSNYQELVDSLESNDAELVLVHAGLPGLEGLSGLEKINNKFPDLKLLVLSDKPSELEGIQLLKSGVLGYANSYISINYLKEAIKVIKMGEIWIGKRLMQWLVNQCTDMTEVSESGNYIDLDSLTETERKVAELLAKANNNKTIANSLGITERTVKAHLSSIFRKTGVNDRLHLMLVLNGNQQ